MTAVSPPTVEVRRMLAGAGQPSLVAHLAVHRRLQAAGRHDARRLQAALAGAGLRGRGGAGFPAGRKLAAAGPRGQLLANCCEGEPASRKDATLLRHAPHLVLDGAQLAARAVRAREVVVGVHAGSAAVVTRAIEERRGYDDVRSRVLEVPDRYVAGEASALARAAGGGPSLPALHDRPLAVRGLDGRPQIVLNAETLAGLALYLGRGADWYAEVGTADEPGTVLLTVRGGPDATVLEVPVGTPVGAALTAAGIDADGVQAVLVGGYFGAWLGDALDVPLSHAGLRAAGGTLGAGVVVALGHDECGLRATAGAVRYLAGQSARQCGPCLNGLPALADALDLLADCRATAAVVDRVAALCGLVTGRGLCAHPDGTAALVRSALRVFSGDVTGHLARRCRRPAGRALGVPA